MLSTFLECYLLWTLEEGSPVYFSTFPLTYMVFGMDPSIRSVVEGTSVLHLSKLQAK